MKKRTIFLVIMILSFILSTFFTFGENIKIENLYKNLISISLNFITLILGAFLPTAQFEHNFNDDDWVEVSEEKCQFKIEISKNKHKMGKNPSIFIFDTSGKEILNADYSNLRMQIAIKKVKDGNVIICSRGKYSGKIVIK